MAVFDLFRRDPLAPPCAYEVEYDNDACTASGARRLADKIEAYWAERGYRVQIRTENRGFVPSMRSARVDIRSDLLNGLPRLRTIPSQEQDQ